MEIQLTSGTATHFKEATEGTKICMAGIDRMVDYLGKGLANICYCYQSRSGHSLWRYHGARGYPLKPKIRTAFKAALVPKPS